MLLFLVSNSLNPCYSGICSVRVIGYEQERLSGSLNPCYSGICSVTGEIFTFKGFYDAS